MNKFYFILTAIFPASCIAADSLEISEAVSASTVTTELSAPEQNDPELGPQQHFEECHQTLYNKLIDILKSKTSRQPYPEAPTLIDGLDYLKTSSCIANRLQKRIREIIQQFNENEPIINLENYIKKETDKSFIVGKIFYGPLQVLSIICSTCSCVSLNLKAFGNDTSTKLSNSIFSFLPTMMDIATESCYASIMIPTNIYIKCSIAAKKAITRFLPANVAADGQQPNVVPEQQTDTHQKDKYTKMLKKQKIFSTISTISNVLLGIFYATQQKFEAKSTASKGIAVAGTLTALTTGLFKALSIQQAINLKRQIVSTQSENIQGTINSLQTHETGEDHSQLSDLTVIYTQTKAVHGSFETMPAQYH